VSWNRLGEWWRSERRDPTYAEEVVPMLLDVLQPQPGELYLDVGCGDGWIMEQVMTAGSATVGCDLNPDLLASAAIVAPVVQIELPALNCLRTESLDGAYVSLVIEHLSDERPLFGGLARAVRPGGVLAVVINHPTFTAAGSTPLLDEDGEVMWRPGGYFDRGHTEEPAGDGLVRFYHRTMAELLNAASEAGWDLQRMMEQGASEAQIERVPDLAGQENIPRLLAVRWSRR
jgi:SAM-dependent methyltransferase